MLGTSFIFLSNFGGPEPLWELGLADNFITDQGFEELLRRDGVCSWSNDHPSLEQSY